MPQNDNEYLPFISGKDIPEDGLTVEVLKVRQYISKSPDGFAGFYIDVHTKAGDGTISMYFGSVLEHMVMQKLVGVSFDLFPYHKGEKTFISTKRTQAKSVQGVQSGSTGNGPMRRQFGR